MIERKPVLHQQRLGFIKNINASLICFDVSLSVHLFVILIAYDVSLMWYLNKELKIWCDMVNYGSVNNDWLGWILLFHFSSPLMRMISDAFFVFLRCFWCNTSTSFLCILVIISVAILCVGEGLLKLATDLSSCWQLIDIT